MTSEDGGAWIIGRELVRVEEVWVMLVDNEEDARRPCALARVFKPEANTVPATNTIADIADYAWNPENVAKVAHIANLRRACGSARPMEPHQCALYAMAVCDGGLRPIKWYPNDPGVAGFAEHHVVTVSLTDFDECGLEELDPAAPASFLHT